MTRSVLNRCNRSWGLLDIVYDRGAHVLDVDVSVKGARAKIWK